MEGPGERRAASAVKKAGCDVLMPAGEYILEFLIKEVEKEEERAKKEGHLLYFGKRRRSQR